MDKLKGYMVINEYGRYAEFDESGLFVKWTSEKCATQYKWAAEAVLLSNPDCKMYMVELSDFQTDSNG